MTAESGVTVNIFGRYAFLSREQLVSAATTTALLGCLDSLSEADQETLAQAYRIIQRATPPASTPGGAS